MCIVFVCFLQLVLQFLITCSVYHRTFLSIVGIQFLTVFFNVVFSCFALLCFSFFSLTYKFTGFALLELWHLR